MAAAGTAFKATAQTYTVTASGGSGINLSLVSDTATPAVLSGIEVYAAHAGGVANPTMDLQVSPDGGTTWTTIASGLTMDAFGRGSYVWTIPTTEAPGNDFLIRAVADEGSHAQGVSNQPFLIANNGIDYYVNDGSTVGDVYTTAPGNDANSGKTPDAPMASLEALLAAYTFEPGDIIYVDTGDYDLLHNLVLGPQDSGVTIVGPSGAVALFNRGNTNSGSYVVQMAGATDVTLENLQLTGGSYGVYAPAGAGSTGLTVSGSTLFANASAGAFLGSGNDDASFINDTVYGIPDQPGAVQGTGIAINSADALLTGNIVYDSSGVGLALSGASADVSGNTAYGDADGISVSGSGSTVNGNTVFDNTSAGIAVSGSVTVSDNTVYGQTGSATGISLTQGAVATGNVVYGNATGIAASYGGSVSDNRVYDNSGAGIVAVLGSIAVQGNDVYGNGTGIDLGEYYTGTVSNNVLEGNTTAGIHDQASPYGGPQYLDNNTIVAEAGNGIQVDGGTVNAELLNNILWAQAGYDIAVAADSEVGFQSDYDLFYATETGMVASWQGQSILTQPDWFYETGNDPHGQFANPQFVDESGPDGVTGFSTAPVGPPVVIDDSSASGFSVTGSWSQQTNGGYLGEHLTAAAGDNTATATWTFTGLTPGADLRARRLLAIRRLPGCQRRTLHRPRWWHRRRLPPRRPVRRLLRHHRQRLRIPVPGRLRRLGHHPDGHALQQRQQHGRGRRRPPPGDRWRPRRRRRLPAPDRLAGRRRRRPRLLLLPGARTQRRPHRPRRLRRHGRRHPQPGPGRAGPLPERPGEVPGRTAGHHRLANRRVDDDGSGGPGRRWRRRRRQLRPRPVPDLHRLVQPLVQ